MRLAARSAVTAITFEAHTGQLALSNWLALAQPGPGLLVLDGVLAANVQVADRIAAELVGAGDLIQPWQCEDAELVCELEWRGLLPTRFALLDAAFADRVTPWPQITAAPLRRAGRRTRRLHVQRAIAAQPRLEVRLALLLWHLAARWGKVEPGGIRLSLPLTHQLLGWLIGAERPSVSHALARLAHGGLVTGHGDDWHLHGSVGDHLASMVEPAGGRVQQLLGPVALPTRPVMRPVEFGPGHAQAERQLLHVLWLTSGLGCDGESVAMTAATSPSLEDLLHGVLPGMPRILLYNAMLAYETGEEFVRSFARAAGGGLDPFVLVLEGSVPNERISGEGHWTGFGVDPDTGQPITACTWIDRLAPRAAAVLALGTCATYGGVPAMRGNPTGAMGLRDYLGSDWTSRLGVPIINLPGCPVQPDNITETLLHVALHLAGTEPIIDLDDHGRPRWLFERTVQESCGRAGFAEQGEFAQTPADHRGCLVKLGCKGPVVNCNVPIRGWIGGVGGCPNVGGICMACTMAGFPDKFMPFMETSRLATLVARGARFTYGRVLRKLRARAVRHHFDVEPGWRKADDELRSGYRPRW